MSKLSKIEQVIEFTKQNTLIRPRDLIRVGLPKDYLHQRVKPVCWNKWDEGCIVGLVLKASISH